MVSGATSMIGSALANRLMECGHEVIAIVRKNSRKTKGLARRSGLSVIECDMSDYEGLSKLYSGTLDAAIALAWDGTRGNARNDREIQANNFKANKDFLRAVIHMGCKKFFTAGSQAEYGSAYNEDLIKEETVPKPNTEYGKYKLLFYEAAKSYCEENGCILIEPRFFSLYGSQDFEGTLIISILKKMLANAQCDLTECIQLWDYLYIDDAVNGLMTLIENKKAEGIYNVGYGDARPLKDFIEEMRKLTNSQSVLNYGAVPYPENGMVNVNPCVKKLKSLGWKPEVTFSEGIRRIIDTLRQ